MTWNKPTSGRPRHRTYWTWSVRTLAALWLVLLTGCATQGSIGPSPEFCAAAHPITIADDDDITDETAKQIENHDLTGAKWCGW